MTRQDTKALVRPLGIPLIGEGAMMLLCLIPSLHFHDATALPILASGLFTIVVGLMILISLDRQYGKVDVRVPYLMVTLIWVVLSCFGTLPFLSTGALTNFTDAFFETISGLSSAGATIFSDIVHLPPSVLLWRSMTQWIGGFGIILIVLAIVPSLGINKYSLYSAEVSGADNTGKSATSVSITIRRTLFIYVSLTLLCILMLYLNHMHIWDAVNLAFSCISSGGFSVYNDSIASLTHAQQYILGFTMFCSGVNFMLMFCVVSGRFTFVRHRLEQFGSYLFITIAASAIVALALHYRMGIGWSDAVRMGSIQSISALTTTGVVVADTAQWWPPILFFIALLSLCGGMAGSTTGGLKVMRVIILFRNVRNILRNRLHPNVVNPVRLNGEPVSRSIINNVMVIFFVFLFIIIIGVFLFMMSGVNATESIGATIACLTCYGPGLGTTGGFGSYAAFPIVAKWLASLLMLLGRLECLTVLVLFTPTFWRK